MFDIGWSEILVIGIVALVVIGPKDLPRVLRALGKWTGQMRRMAGEFRRQFDDAMREAELTEVTDAVRDIKKELGKAGDDLRKVASDTQSTLDDIPKSIEAPKPAEPAAAPGAAVNGATETAAGHGGPADVVPLQPAGEPVATDSESDEPKRSVAQRAADAWKKAAGDESGA